MVNLGQMLGAKLGPKLHENQKQWGTKAMLKNRQKNSVAVVRQGYAAAHRNLGLPTKEFLWDHLNIRVQEYKCPAGKSIRGIPLLGQRPGVESYSISV